MRTMDAVEQVAVTILASTIPARPALQGWMTKIVNNPDYAEYEQDAVDGEMQQDIRDFIPVTSDEDATEGQRVDQRILDLARAVVEHRHGNYYDRTQLPQVRLADIDTDRLPVTRGLAASLVNYTASLVESVAKAFEALEDARS